MERILLRVAVERSRLTRSSPAEVRTRLLAEAAGVGRVSVGS